MSRVPLSVRQESNFEVFGSAIKPLSRQGPAHRELDLS